MKSSTLVRLPFVMLLICLLWGDGWGAAAKVDCLAEEEQLQSHESEQCSGFGYLFNPSACIKARKALASFKAGECEQPARDVLPQQPAAPAALPAETAPRATAVTQPAPVTESLPEPVKIADAAVVPDSDIDQLRREIAALRAEVQQLRKEVAAIKGGTCLSFSARPLQARPALLWQLPGLLTVKSSRPTPARFSGGWISARARTWRSTALSPII